MDDVIKILESVERFLIDGATETVKHEIKKAKSWFLGTIMTPITAALIAPMAF